MSDKEDRLTMRHWLMAVVILAIICVFVPMMAGFV